jgi:2-polyprenyl-3-methyl-5-hydroxy-6-metoxy-1,4-benzoquinol methylase
MKNETKQNLTTVELKLSESYKRLVHRFIKIPVYFGLSRKKHLPCIYVGESRTVNYPPYRLDVFKKFYGMKKSKSGNVISIAIRGFIFKLLPEYATCLETEWADWNTYYRPPFPLENKTVIDIGAGCGETILFFALKGCRNFIAIEPNEKCVDMIQQNAKSNGLNIKTINDCFKPEHLELSYDYIKCDCEGGEEILLGKKNKPVSLEVHGAKMVERFGEEGYITIHNYNNGTRIMRNY